MFELNDDWPDTSYFEESEADRKDEANRAASEPNFDVFEAHRLVQPKFEIGKYVADQGFRVPYIAEQSDWEQAFDDGTAMLRSEMRQDYDGLSGLLSSERLTHSLHNRPSAGFAQEFGSLVMKGLRSGELSGAQYMTNFRNVVGWADRRTRILEKAMRFGVELELEEPTASRWRYIEGTNATVFADPNVEGRYHLGVIPARQPNGRLERVGSYQVESREHEKPQTFRKHSQPFIAKPFIDFYDEISKLPYFDTTQHPVLEMQQDLEGNLYFLQYLKTGQSRLYVEPFDLPHSSDSLKTSNVRGVTPPEGMDFRVYIAPKKLTKGMEGQGIMCTLNEPRDLEVQFASRSAGFILHEAYVTFQDNHFNSAPLYRPPLAAGLAYTTEETNDSVWEKAREVAEVALFGPKYRGYDDVVPYIEARVTSNGRDAVIESDWTVKDVAYSDIT